MAQPFPHLTTPSFYSSTPSTNSLNTYSYKFFYDLEHFPIEKRKVITKTQYKIVYDGGIYTSQLFDSKNAVLKHLEFVAPRYTARGELFRFEKVETVETHYIFYDEIFHSEEKIYQYLINNLKLWILEIHPLLERGKIEVNHDEIIIKLKKEDCHLIDHLLSSPEANIKLFKYQNKFIKLASTLIYDHHSHIVTEFFI